MSDQPWITVADPADPRIDVFMGLRDRQLRQRRRDGLFIAEGDIVISRAQAAGYKLVSILVDAKRRQPLESGPLDQVPVYAATVAVLQEISGFDQYRGAMACFERKPLPDLNELLERRDLRTVAVTEGVTNPTNLGVLLRSAAGLGVDAVVADPTSVDPLSRRCARVSMGEGFARPHTRCEALPEGLGPFTDAGYRILALTPGSSNPGVEVAPLASLQLSATDRVAILIGAEGPGLSPATLAAADQCLSIEMSGTVDSLNAGAAAAISFYAIDQARG